MRSVFSVIVELGRYSRIAVAIFGFQVCTLLDADKISSDYLG